MVPREPWLGVTDGELLYVVRSKTDLPLCVPRMKNELPPDLGLIVWNDLDTTVQIHMMTGDSQPEKYWKGEEMPNITKISSPPLLPCKMVAK